MRFRKVIIALLTISVLFLGDSFASNITSVLIQDKSNVTAQEKEEVQDFAKRFVERMLETRDVTPLINEFFLTGFISFFEQDYYEKVLPKLYSRLSTLETKLFD
ncbi:MAG: hypothetical protein M3407_08395 [Acidobacteriota bacterium]|jgi:hypothetical protein|nr:hypothetical protein [Acidobacteriota bacterium]